MGKNSTLKDLNLCKNQMGSVYGLVSTSAKYEPGYGIEREGALAFASMLKRNQSLKTLWLCDDSVGIEGAISLIESLQENTTLSDLWISQTCKPRSFSTLDTALRERVHIL